MKRNWVITTFNFVVEKFISGGAFPKQYQGKKEGYYPFAKVADISKLYRQGYKDIESATNFITQAEQKELKTPIFPINTIVFPKIGEALKNNYRLITNKPMLFDNNVMGIVTNPNKAVVKYIYYFLLAQDFGKLSVATTIPSVRSADIGNLQIPVPPMAEQKRIVKKIEELFGVIDEQVKRLEATHAALVSYRQSILQQAFSGKLCKTPTWEEVPLKKCCLPVIKRKDSKDPSEKFLYLDIASIDNKTNKIIEGTPYTGDTAPSRARQIVQKDDILFSTVRTYLKNIALITDSKYDNQIASTGFCVIRANQKMLLPHFIFYKTLSRCIFITSQRQTAWI